MTFIIQEAKFNAIIGSAMHTAEQIKQTIENQNLDIQVFTRITKNTDELLEQVAEKQDRSKSYILRKALEMYINNSV
jgi:hypothetical protein